MPCKDGTRRIGSDGLPEKKFDGTNYIFHEGYQTEKQAKDESKELKQKGYNVRLNKLKSKCSNYPFEIFIRKKEGYPFDRPSEIRKKK